MALALITGFGSDTSEDLIHDACLYNMVSVVRILIHKHGVSIMNHRDCYNETPLQSAVRRGSEEMAMALITEFSSDTNEDLIHGACERNMVSVVRILVHKHGVSIVNRLDHNNGNTLLHSAVLYGREETALAMITEYSCDTNEDLIHDACKNNMVSVVRALIHKHGTNHQRDGRSPPHILIAQEYLGTPLHEACGYGHLDMVRMLITEFKADVNTEVDFIGTPLERAMELHREEVAFALITEFNCDTGFYLINFACKYDMVSVVRALTNKHGPNVNHREWNISLEEAVKDGREEMATLTTEFGSKFNKDIIHHACRMNMVGVVRTLIHKHGRNILNHRDSNNDTPLHTAIEYGIEDVALVLINEYNCDISVKGFGGNSLLHTACGTKQFNLSLIRTLIHQHKADVNAK